ncbi:MAG: hypothetical protein ACHQX3_10990 [Nitrospirales bacterium]|jgi:hypothetical protein
MNRHLTVRDLSGTRILGDFTPPAGASPQAELVFLAAAMERAADHASSGAVIWSAYEPVAVYSPWRSHA